MGAVMTDRLSKERRSWNMSRIRAAHTLPELRVRSLLHRMGYRFRVHRKDLPGSPDIVLPKHRTVVFVHGCFWHRHAECRFAYTPKSRIAFWTSKFTDNVVRDRRNVRRLIAMGWRVVTVWECQVANEERLRRSLSAALAE